MVFSSLVFIFNFLPILLILYFLAKEGWRNFILLCFSLFFYAWGEPTYVWLMLFSIGANYFFGHKVHKDYKEHIHRKIWITLTVIFNIGLLAIFKYTNFIVDNINYLFGISINVPEISLPLGISFFTFQAMSYVIDVYRDDAKYNKSFVDIALYITLFPQLVAGPIVRYQTVADQICKRSVTLDRFANGTKRFIKGLGKKVIIANSLGLVADQLFQASSVDLSVTSAWIGAIAYSLQIYFDFSGYSDMAIGLGLMFGFEFLENFNYPYISKSVSEFWRRWHMSLGTWFKDYVYIPLGGNRVSPIKKFRNLMIVWALTGLWHGASWNFMMWGIYFGLFIVLENAFLGEWLKKLWAPLQHAYLLLIVIFGWVFFRAPDLTQAVIYLKSMLGLNANVLYDQTAQYFITDYWYMFVLAILISMPVYQWFCKKVDLRGSRERMTYHVASSALHMGVFSFTLFQLVNSSFNPFIYFRF